MAHGNHNLLDVLQFAHALSPAVGTDNTARSTAIVDMQAYESVTWVIVTGDLADVDATFAVTVMVGDAANLSDAAAAHATNLIGSGNFDFAADSAVRAVSYVPSFGGPAKRYARLTVTPANNTGNAPIAAIAILKPYIYGK